MLKGYSFSRLSAWTMVRASGALGLNAKHHGRPIFVVSMPRSGSSWVGSILGRSRDARYIREPFTRMKTAVDGGAAVVKSDPHNLPLTYASTARKLHCGAPDFRPSVIGHNDQWPPFSNTSRRLVVKEVNPLASAWFIEQFEPHLILLLRHPAAIAASYRTQGWKGEDRDFWGGMGSYVAETWEKMFEMTAGYDHCTYVKYEDLCVDANAGFRSLYESVDLPWDADVGHYLDKLSAIDGTDAVSSQSERNDSQKGAYSLSRPTHRMAYNWRSQVDERSLSQVMEGFQRTQLPRCAQYLAN